MKVACLSGGVGGAKLAAGLYDVLAPGELTVIGNVGGGEQRSFAVIGDTTNVAARLQTISEPGHILVARRTLDDVRSSPDVQVDVRPIGPTDLKGKTRPTEAFELLSIS